MIMIYLSQRHAHLQSKLKLRHLTPLLMVKSVSSPMHLGQRALFGCFSPMCSYLGPVGKAVMSVHSRTRANSRKLPSVPRAAALAHGLWPVPMSVWALRIVHPQVILEPHEKAMSLGAVLIE